MTNDRFDANKWYIQQRTSSTPPPVKGGFVDISSSSIASSSSGISSSVVSSGGISSGGISGGVVSPPPVYPPTPQPQPKKNHLSTILCILSILAVIIVALILIVIISGDSFAYSGNYSAIICEAGNKFKFIDQFKNICLY